jgi:hypothetical protein
MAAGVAEDDGDVVAEGVVTRAQGVGPDGQRVRRLQGEEKGKNHLIVPRSALRVPRWLGG